MCSLYGCVDCLNSFLLLTFDFFLIYMVRIGGILIREFIGEFIWACIWVALVGGGLSVVGYK